MREREVPYVVLTFYRFVGCRSVERSIRKFFQTHTHTRTQMHKLLASCSELNMSIEYNNNNNEYMMYTDL